jgi:hypothetical protein
VRCIPAAAALAACATLAACGGPEAVRTYEGAPRDKAEIAVLKTLKFGTASGGFASIGSLDITEPKEARETRPQPKVVWDAPMGVHPFELQVLPGHYEVRLQCVQPGSGSGYVALPAIRLHLVAGFTYEVHCTASRSHAQTRRFDVALARRYRTDDLSPAR